MLKNLKEKIELQCMNYRESVGFPYIQACTCATCTLNGTDSLGEDKKTDSICSNHAKCQDVRHLIEQLCAEIEKEESDGSYFDFTGMRLHGRTIDAIVLEYAPKVIRLGITDTTVINTSVEKM